MTVITDLHRDLLTNILVRLPPKRLLQNLCTLKSWNELISSDAFCRAYLKKSVESNEYRILVMSQEAENFEDEEERMWQELIYPTRFYSAPFYPEDVFGRARRIDRPLIRRGRVTTKIVGCVDGLVCIYNKQCDQDLAVWNPSIQRYRRIPFAPIEVPAAAKTGHMEDVKYGFGYDPSTEDYKVVRVCEFRNGQGLTVCSEVMVYGLKTRSWKQVESFSCTWIGEDAIPLNGAIHWFGKLEPLSDGLRVLALDLQNEIFSEFRTPFERRNAMSLQVLDEKLCIGVYKGGNQHNIWEMKIYGVSDSWSHLYTIQQGIAGLYFEHLLPLALSKTGKGILMHDNSDMTEENFFWYDPKKNTAEAVRFPSMPSVFTAAVCVANIGLLDGEPLIKPRQQQVLPMKREIGSSEGEGSEQAEQGGLN